MSVGISASIVCLLVSLGQAESVPNTPPPGGIVAVVGDDVITKAELDQQVDLTILDQPKQEAGDYIARFRLELQHRELRRLVEDKLVLQQVKRFEAKEGRGYITDPEIEKQLKRRIEMMNEQNGGTGEFNEDPYDYYSKRLGISRKELKEFYRDQLSVEKYKWEQIYPRIDSWVSPARARAFYKQNSDMFSTPKEITFRMISIKNSRPDAFEAAEAVERALGEGGGFVELAQTYDDDVVDPAGFPEFAGQLQTKSFDSLRLWHRPIPETLRRMKPGTTSKRVMTAVGIHFFQVEDLVAGQVESFSEALTKIRNHILVERRKIELKNFLTERREKTRVAVFLPELPKQEPISQEAKRESEAKRVPQANEE